MMTPDRKAGDEEDLMGYPIGNHEDHEPNETMEDEPSDINNSLNTSVLSENCKIINESDQLHSPCPDPEGITTVNLMGGGMNGGDIVPDSANLTPVKLDDGLKEQDTFTSSPTYSRDEFLMSDEDQSPLLSRRQQRMRIARCYGVVVIVVFICAIGIPLGAVMLFNKSSTETSFDSASDSNNSPSTTAASPDAVASPAPPEITNAPTGTITEPHTEPPTEAPPKVTENPVIVDEEDTTDAPIESQNVGIDMGDDQWLDDDELVPDEDGNTDPPLGNQNVNIEMLEALAENAGNPDYNVTQDPSAELEPVATDPVEVEQFATNYPSMMIDDFGERNVTSITIPPVIDAVPEATDVPVETTDAPLEDEATLTTTPTASPTARPVMVTSSLPPTAPTTPGPDRSDIYFDLINVTSPAVLQDTSTAQALSYLWLVEKDQVLPVPSGRYLLQRYILVVLDHMLHDPVSPGLSQATSDHCLWEGIVCDVESGDVKEINWRLKGLNGTLVEEMKYLDSLERLDLSENGLVGTLDHLYGATSLRHVYLHNNHFSGTLSEQVGQLELLESLYLNHNQLTGFLPISLRSSVGKSKPLKWLILSHNKFTGYVPPDWRMRSLYYLDLGYNELSGPLPYDWDVNMISIRHVFLDHNSFSGVIPDYFGQLGKGRMKQLYLNDNLLEGKVPETWEPKDQLTNMAFHNNNLTVPIQPAVCEMSIFELGNMVELRTACDICTCDFLCEMCVE